MILLLTMDLKNGDRTLRIARWHKSATGCVTSGVGVEPPIDEASLAPPPPPGLVKMERFVDVEEGEIGGD